LYWFVSSTKLEFSGKKKEERLLTISVSFEVRLHF
jgi:hypothetical protein